MQDSFLAVYHQGMSGIVAALKAHHTLCVIGKPIHNFALAFITPLCTDYYDVLCHCKFLIFLIFQINHDPRRITQDQFAVTI